jgi:hypothetical protein
MTKPIFSVLLSAVSVSLLAAGCSSSSDDGGSTDEGGGGSAGSSGSSGASSGTSGSAATSTGGAGTSGASSGGAGTSGASTGGTATGGASTGGTGPGSPGCESACARVIAAACGTTTQAECVEGCESLSTACAAEVPAYTECVSNPANAITCNTAAMTAEIAGCDDVIQDLSVCGVCLPTEGDMACGTCARSSCCDELQTYVAASDIQVFDACVTPCEDQACVDACTAASPVAGAAYAALGDCQIGDCGEECVCEANPDDPECIACLKVGCCGDLVPYAAAPDVADFVACIEPCAADQACIDSCISDFPEAGNAYSTLITCAGDSCLSECSG